jgi:hypothetical protein
MYPERRSPVFYFEPGADGWYVFDGVAVTPVVGPLTRREAKRLCARRNR